MDYWRGLTKRSKKQGWLMMKIAKTPVKKA
jgi:hypothetical protein